MSRRTVSVALVLFTLLAAGCHSEDQRPAVSTPVVAAPAVAAPVGTSFPEDAARAAEQNRADVAPGLEVAIFAGGCFWGMEELLRKVPGVVSTDVGYAGGDMALASYDHVKTGTTHHAESVKVVFDPRKTSYETLVAYFFRIHDPTTPDRQGNDVGSQYRSVIFYQSPEQERIANAVKQRAEASGKLPGPITTQIIPAMPFERGEEHHQDYLQKHPSGYTCHFERPYEI